MDYFHSDLGMMSAGSAFVLNGVQYPRNWLRLATESERTALGFYVTSHQNKANEEYYFVQNPVVVIENGVAVVQYPATPREIEDVLAVDSDGNPVLDVVYYQTANDGTQTPVYGAQTVYKGLKSKKISNVKAAAGSLMSASDWYVVRATEDATKPVPTDIADYRSAVRLISSQIEQEILDCTNIDELALVDVGIEGRVQKLLRAG